MGTSKGEGKIRSLTERSAKEKSAEPIENVETTESAKEPKSAEEARTDVRTRVWKSAGAITDGLIVAAKSGRLVAAKYLFEMAGVHPATEGTTSDSEDSLAYAVLKSLGLPTEGLDGGEEETPMAVTRMSAQGDTVK